MKKAMLMLFAMVFVVSLATAGFDGMADPSGQKAFDGKWDEGKCFENGHGHPGPCTEICPGSRPHDKCGCDHGCKEQCDCGKKYHGNDHCFVFEKCDECGKTVCDGFCKDCEKRCDVYEYCTSCDAKYWVEHADGRCDRCSKDCYCIEKCIKCDYNHYYNGYCDECADRCYYARCCLDFDHEDHACDTSFGEKCPEKCDSCMEEESCDDAGPTVFIKYLGAEDGADAGPEMEDGYPEADGIDSAVQDEYADQIPLIYPSAEEAPIDEAPIDEAPVDESQPM